MTRRPRTSLRVGLISLGCPKNLVDSELMLGRLRERGHAVVTDPRCADVIVVNTCAFIADARRESVNTILEMALNKSTGRSRRLVVTGCLAQRYDHELRREIPEIDATLGPGQIERIAEAVEGGTTAVDPSPPRWIYDHTSPRLLATPPYLAYVKIGEGCDYRCSFCAIPAIRGRQRSRRPDDVVAEVQHLADRGVKEVVLIAQDTTRYGVDLGLPDALPKLLRRLGRIDGLAWIRLMYAHPATLTDRVLETIASEDRVVKYLDVPLQHASSSVLRRMGRPWGRLHGAGLIERVRRTVPNAALRTSFIVGFPGETERDFEQLVKLVEETRFDHLGVFRFSPEESTPALHMPARPPVAVAKRRYRRLMAIQKRISRDRNRARVGERVKVLVEGVHPESDLLLRGRLPTQAPEIDGSVIIGEGRATPGSLVEGEILQGHAYDLVVRLV